MKIDVYSPTIRRKEMDAVLTAMVEDMIGPGEQAKLLIQTARERLKFDFCLALRSPAIALHLALRALDLKEGQGVVISALSPLYYARVIEDMGLVALYCDVQSPTACISRETVEKAIAAKPESAEIGCIVMNHTLGYLCDGLEIAELGVPLIEDCSQSYGAVIGEPFMEESGAKTAGTNQTGTAPAGQSPGAAIVSSGCAAFTILGLEERDMLTSGGGALLYTSKGRSSRSRVEAAVKNSGLPSDLPPELGLPDMNAAMAVVQFREAAKNLLKRREIVRLYTQSVLRTRHKLFVQTDVRNPKAQNEKDIDGDLPEKLPVQYNNYAFPLILETGMKDVKAYARRKDIAVESAFENTPAGCGIVPPEKCPEAYSLSLRTVLFPVYPRLGMTDAGKVAKLILTLP